MMDKLTSSYILYFKEVLMKKTHLERANFLVLLLKDMHLMPLGDNP